jgi:hypothetical protein
MAWKHGKKSREEGAENLRQGKEDALLIFQSFFSVHFCHFGLAGSPDKKGKEGAKSFFSSSFRSGIEN